MNELRATPILTGKSAKRFYKEINNKEMSNEQREFLEECIDMVKDSKIRED